LFVVMNYSSAIVLFCILGFVLAEQSCPKVFDGLTNGNFDLASQFSTKEISANWAGLSRKEVLAYEWGIVSEDKLNNNRLSVGACSKTQPFAGLPDTQRYKRVDKATSATAKNLNLETGKTYYVVLKTTLSNGEFIYSMSNGILVLPQELNLEGSHKQSNGIFETSEESNTESKRFDTTLSECPIDEANRCTAGTVSVREKLAELYGPPRFLAVPVFAVAVPPDDDDDDDDDDGDNVYLPIVIGVLAAVLLLLCCLLLLAALMAVFKGDGGSDKFTETVTTSHTDHVDADFGTTTEHKIADDTRVEFPDYDPSTRLSVA